MTMESNRDAYPPLDLALIAKKKQKFISSEEALKDVIPMIVETSADGKNENQ